MIKIYSETDEHPYYNQIYGLKIQKLVFFTSPRAGCTFIYQNLLDITGQLHNINKETPVHVYMNNLENIEKISLNNISDFYIYKSIINPYHRAVAIFINQYSHELSFKEYLKKMLVSNNFLSDIDKYHSYPQYIPFEEKYIKEYIKIDEIEENIELKNKVEINYNKFKGITSEKTKKLSYIFFGDLNPFEYRVYVKTYNIIPPYSWFYNDEIQTLVYKLYSVDFQAYKYKYTLTDNFIFNDEKIRIHDNHYNKNILK